MEPAVRLRAVVSLLGRFPALAGIDLDVDTGEIVHLQGPNGAGKTSLLRLCAGLDRVAQGEATVLGHDLGSDRRAVRRQVGFLAHETHLYDDLSVAENVGFWVKVGRADPAGVDPALAVLRLDGRLRETPAGKLSEGQRRRASLAVLVARRPKLWLLDEPHAGLDAASRDLVDDLIRNAAGSGATILLASHEIDRAGPVSSRTVFLAGGIVRRDTGIDRTEPAPGREASPGTGDGDAVTPNTAGVAGVP